MIMILFGALSADTKTYLSCMSDRHAFMPAFCNTLSVGCLKFCFSLETRSSIWPFTISFQNDRTESSTISCLAHFNAYWSTASHKSNKFLSQSTLHGSLYFGPFSIRSLNLEFEKNVKIVDFYTIFVLLNIRSLQLYYGGMDTTLYYKLHFLICKTNRPTQQKITDAISLEEGGTVPAPI